jgi:copper resistance protein B
MKSLVLALAVILAAGVSLAAEDPHAHHRTPAAKPAAGADAHADHAAPEKAAEDSHAGHASASGAVTPAQAPPPPNDHAADRIFGAAAMAASREMLHHEHGAHVFSKVMIDTLEYAALRGQDGMRWQGEAWFGGDINRAVVKTEGEGEISGATHHAEVQALYSRAIGPYFDLQAGLRHDIKPSPWTRGTGALLV